MALLDNLIAYWKLNESSGNASDSIGSNTLTNNNSATYTTGKLGNSITLNGTSQYLSRAAVSSATTNLSIALWAYIPSTSTRGCFFHNGNVSTFNGGGYSLGVGNSEYGNNGNNFLGLLDNVAWINFGAIGAAGWHFFVMTRDATTWRGYIDGSVSATTSTDDPTDTATATAETRIGRDTNSLPRYWGNKVDEVGFWEKCLTQDEITQLYNSGAGLDYPFEMTATTGSIALTGNDASVSSNRNLTTVLGEFTLTGQDTDFLTGYSLIADTYNITLTWSDVILTPFSVFDTEPAAGSYTYDSEVGSRLAWAQAHRTWTDSHYTWASSGANHTRDTEASAGSYTYDSI